MYGGGGGGRMHVCLLVSFDSVTIINSAIRPGMYILLPETAKVPCGQRSQDSMSHRGPIFAAGDRHCRLWAEPTRFSESHFPPKTGRMVTLPLEHRIETDMIKNINFSIQELN